jgi:3-isopropylmalate/(R)-2-methylmalate dehydratase large subunit
MEGRMTVCNMAIEAGARVGFVAVDDITIAYLKGLGFAPKGARLGQGGRVLARPGVGRRCAFDAVIELRCRRIKPQVTWGTSPEMVRHRRKRARIPRISRIR